MFLIYTPLESIEIDFLCCAGYKNGTYIRSKCNNHSFIVPFLRNSELNIQGLPFPSSQRKTPSYCSHFSTFFSDVRNKEQKKSTQWIGSRAVLGLKSVCLLKALLVCNIQSLMTRKSVI